jgi:hypothetical protein
MNVSPTPVKTKVLVWTRYKAILAFARMDIKGIIVRMKLIDVFQILASMGNVTKPLMHTIALVLPELMAPNVKMNLMNVSLILASMGNALILWMPTSAVALQDTKAPTAKMKLIDVSQILASMESVAVPSMPISAIALMVALKDLKGNIVSLPSLMNVSLTHAKTKGNV